MADLVTQEAAHGLNQVTFTAAAAGDTVESGGALESGGGFGG
jgi:hypothetical protein